MHLPIYMDHAATTPVAPEVLDAMIPYFTVNYGNPSAIHSIGTSAREAVEESRARIAEIINADPEEIVFTSGGTESDNAALFGIAHSPNPRGRHLLTSPIEHHAVLEPLESLAEQGWELEIAPIEPDGLIDPGELIGRIRKDTGLVSIMHANNEIGTIQPIAEIGAFCRASGIPFHTDAVQTLGRLPIDVKAMNLDLMSFSAHKFYGPKGTGALYVRRGTLLKRFQEGGGQERGRRAGTLNVPGIVGMGKALQIAQENMKSESQRLTAMRDCMIQKIHERISGVYFTGHLTKRLPHNVHVCFEGIEGETLLLALDAAGICASAGSACSAGSVEQSHVLKAIGMNRNLARGAVRFTLGRSTSDESIEYCIQILERTLKDLRP